MAAFVARSTKDLPDVGQVEVRTHVVLVGKHGTVEGGTAVVTPTGWVKRALDSGDMWVEVVSEWICPDCGQVHGDQQTTDPRQWQCH